MFVILDSTSLHDKQAMMATIPNPMEDIETTKIPLQYAFFRASDAAATTSGENKVDRSGDDREERSSVTLDWSRPAFRAAGTTSFGVHSAIWLLKIVW